MAAVVLCRALYSVLGLDLLQCSADSEKKGMLLSVSTLQLSNDDNNKAMILKHRGVAFEKCLRESIVI